MALQKSVAPARTASGTVTASLITTSVAIETRTMVSSGAATSTATGNEVSAALLERAEAMTPLLQKILSIRPPPHYGINE